MNVAVWAKQSRNHELVSGFHTLPIYDPDMQEQLPCLPYVLAVNTTKTVYFSSNRWIRHQTGPDSQEIIILRDSDMCWQEAVMITRTS